MQTPPVTFTPAQRAALADELDMGDPRETARVIARLSEHAWLFRERTAIGAAEDRRAKAHRAWMARVERQAAALEDVIRGRLPDDVIVLRDESPSLVAVARLRSALHAFRARPHDDLPDPHIQYPYDLALTCGVADVLDSEGWDVGKGRTTSPMPTVLAVVLRAVGRRRVTDGVINRLIDDARKYLPEWRAQSIDAQYSIKWRHLRNL